MPHGGARPGSGRKKLESSKLRDALIRKAEIHADALSDSIIGKALGLEAHKAADVQAHKEILDRVIGKPVQGIDHTTNGESLRFELTPEVAVAMAAMDEAVKRQMQGDA